MSVKSLQKCLKTHLEILTNILLYYKYRMSSLTGKIIQFSAVAKKGDLYNKAEIEKEAVGFLVICHLVAGNLHKVAAPYFLSLFSLFSCIKEIVQSCEHVGLSGRSSPQYRANSQVF